MSTKRVREQVMGNFIPPSRPEDVKLARGTQPPMPAYDESRLVELATSDIEGVTARMRSSLAAITLDLCLIDDSRSGDLARTLSRIGRSVEAMELISDELSDLAAIARDAMVLERRSADLRALVELVLAENLTPRDRSRCVVSPAETCLVDLDRKRIERAILTLVTTALATSLRDEIVIRVDPRPGTVRVTIGEVAMPGSLDAAFDRSPRGLGLRLCRTVVEAHGGAVGATAGSTGARLWIELPTQDGDARQQVLVVDHDATHTAAIATALAKQNMAVTIAASGSTALELVRTRRLDIVLITAELPDVAVPDLIAQLRHRVPGLHIVVSSLAPALNVDAIVRECLLC